MDSQTQVFQHSAEASAPSLRGTSVSQAQASRGVCLFNTSVSASATVSFQKQKKQWGWLLYSLHKPHYM